MVQTASPNLRGSGRPGNIRKLSLLSSVHPVLARRSSWKYTISIKGNEPEETCMGSRKHSHHHQEKKDKSRSPHAAAGKPAPRQPPAGRTKLEIILKCDTAGNVEAVSAAIIAQNLPEVEINIISSGVDDVHKSDIFMAETGSRLIVGFNVGTAPHVEQIAAEHNVEIRLYEIIYRLLEDLRAIAESLVQRQISEEILGSAKVIALFKSSRRGIIAGCEVLTGKLTTGRAFRILSAMGPVYSGKIESLHIGKDAVGEAVKGQQAGLKIKNFNKVRVGDLVESFQSVPGQTGRPWQPQGRVLYR